MTFDSVEECTTMRATMLDEKFVSGCFEDGVKMDNGESYEKWLEANAHHIWLRWKADQCQ